MPPRGLIASMGRLDLSRPLVVLALLAASGCSGGAGEAPPESPSTQSGERPDEQAQAWSIDEARVDHIPDDPPLRTSLLPKTFPADDAVFPDLLTDPPGQARLTYHPRETFADYGGWVTERVFFLGVDGSWRSLEMLDLGLPETTHPGTDTYGAGELSPDGTQWAAKTNAGIVLVDLRSARSRVVALPGDYTNYLAWRPDGRRVDVVRLSGASTQRTWSIDPKSFEAVRAQYRLPIDGYANDGTVVTFTKRNGNTERTVHRDGEREVDSVPVPYRHVRLGGAVGPTHGMFGLIRGLLILDGISWSPLARLRLQPRDRVGWPRGWWQPDTVWFYEGTRGLLTWNVDTGEVGALIKVTPPSRPDSYWTASVAVDLMR